MKHPLKHEAFIRLVNESQPLLQKVCNLYCATREDREDLYQEIIIQLWKAWPAFRAESRISTWLYRIALNTAISGLRKKKRSLRLVYSEKAPEAVQECPDWHEKENQLRQLYEQIRKLSEIERAVVMLYLDEKTYDEMEEILGVNQNNLRVKMNRIKEKLRQLTHIS